MKKKLYLILSTRLTGDWSMFDAIWASLILNLIRMILGS